MAARTRVSSSEIPESSCLRRRASSWISSRDMRRTASRSPSSELVAGLASCRRSRLERSRLLRPLRVRACHSAWRPTMRCGC